MRVKPETVKRKTPLKVLNKSVIQMGADNDCVNVTLHKTVRIPDDGKSHGLPPSIGLFTVHKVDDYRNTVPKEWLSHGGVFICMYQREAMWLKFDSVGNQPKAMKIGVGKVNAINGKNWNAKLGRYSNDYIVVPDQKWLDGIATNKNFIKQFVAMPLGSGYTVESQITGKDEFGGIQMLTYNSKNRVQYVPPPVYNPPTYYPPIYNQPPTYIPPMYNPPPVVCQNVVFPAPSCRRSVLSSEGARGRGGFSGYSAQPVKRNMKKKKAFSSSRVVCEEESLFYDGDGGGEAKELGISAGGKMRQKVYKDRYGYNKWDQSKSSKVFIHIVNSEMFEQITGEKCPDSTITKQTYITYGYPWLEIYEERRRKGIGGNRNWRKVNTVNEIDNQRLYSQLQYYETNNSTSSSNNGGLTFSHTVNYDPNNVRDGDW